jgi:hypothetical protein
MRLNASFRQSWVRACAAAVVSLLVVAAIAVFGSDGGNEPQNVKLLSGMAWLSSSNVGQVTLLDGSTAEVAAQLPIAPAGSTIEVVQSGSTAYAVDRTAGTVQRVDGATFDLTKPQSPIADAHTGLTAFAGQDVLYVLDSQRGVYTDADPRTVAPLGEPQTLAAQLGDGTASLDDAGRLWLVDNASGNLTSIDRGKRTTKSGVTKPGHNVLAMADGAPVIVNTGEHKVISVDPDSGTAAKTLDLDLRTNDTVAVSGSPHAQRVYVVASRGVVNICDLGAASCERAIPLNAGSQLGAAVEAANRLFVPDYTTGQVWIIDLNSGAVVAKPQVLKPAGQFQLLAHDGVVFFNQPTSEKAGVVQVDGNVLATAKYDPLDPKKGTTTPSNAANVPPPSQQNNPTRPTSSPNEPNRPNPSTRPTPQSGPNTPTPTVPHPSDPGGPAQPTPSDPGHTSDPPQPPVPKLTISAAPTAPIAGDPVSLGVKADDGQALKNVHWTFNGTGADAGNGAGSPVNHTWANAGGPFLVTVQAEIPDGRTVVGSTQVSVGTAPTTKVTLTVTGSGKVSGGPFVNCAATCVEDVDRRRNVTLTATPNAGSVFSMFNVFECGQPGKTTCVLVMSNHPDHLDVPAIFKVPKPPTHVTVKVTTKNGAGGTVNVRTDSKDTTSCVNRTQPTKTCAPVTVPDPDQAIDLNAFPDSGSVFEGWTAGSCAPGTTPNCGYNVFRDETVEGVFTKAAAGFVWILPLVGLGLPTGALRRRRSRGRS